MSARRHARVDPIGLDWDRDAAADGSSRILEALMRHPRLNEGQPYTAATAADVLLRIATNRDFTPVLQINDERVQRFEIEFGGDEPVLSITLNITPAVGPELDPLAYVASVTVRRRFVAPPTPTKGELHRWISDDVRDSLANVVEQLNVLAVGGLALEY